MDAFEGYNIYYLSEIVYCDSTCLIYYFVYTDIIETELTPNGASYLNLRLRAEQDQEFYNDEYRITKYYDVAGTFSIEAYNSSVLIANSSIKIIESKDISFS